ncbi:peptidoglycan recognition family protein [Streptomyces europaeiscabiei]|uniref:Peptidoglycan recognition family protein n=1 Tax=Streptomyces europaeiscabiei TaxID=146819 RepID=A0ABU4NBH9_9ACTN|nr:peptidoglycan recognition family protein [Streptomyces europaeiscabiei]MDX3542336.1 peptidoglycan recognition family protein [Streptomyces europaeiscabiei]MDX3550202.1 peptidoglycan recognition family protein [Streptomyces europaeiscabiei]MDX3699238.1 peptidoglycan recognition family protein [Streptomyces europaeiscabiei]
MANGGDVLITADPAAGSELKAPDGAPGLRSPALDTRHGPDRRVVVPSAPTRVRGVEYLTRAARDSDESLRFKADGTENPPTAFYPFQTITVHHTAMANDDLDPAATLRAIHQLHAVTNDWGDIGCHFLVDEEGRIHEGRCSGDDGLPAHDASGRLVTAFHVGGFNSGNLGIALLGTYTERSPREAARASLKRLVKVLVRRHGVDPQARVTYTNHPVNGARKKIAEISGPPGLDGDRVSGRGHGPGAGTAPHGRGHRPLTTHHSPLTAVPRPLRSQPRTGWVRSWPPVR